MIVKVYVEGGGDRNKALQTQCRRGFSEFVKKNGLAGRMPRIVAYSSSLSFIRDRLPLLLDVLDGPQPRYGGPTLNGRSTGRPTPKPEAPKK